ncbi:Na+/proline symporter [Lachnospiraceae bacterium NE2001]|nr:Na+/proline symporter [Lachnospiraceae bacterium NE2001]
MNIRRFALGDGSASSVALSSIVFTAGFTTAVILPFYLYLFGAGIFWEYLGIAICTLIVWGVESYPLMRYKRKSKNILTLPGFFEYRFKARGGILRLFAAVEIVVLSIVLAALLVKELCIILGTVMGLDATGLMVAVLLLLSSILGLTGIDLVFKTAWPKAVILVIGLAVVAIYMYFSMGNEKLMRALMSSDITGSVSRYLDTLYHDGKLLEPEDYISLLSMGLLAAGMPFMLGIFFSSKSAKGINKGRKMIVVYGILLFEAAFFTGAISRGYLHPEKLTNSLSQYISMMVLKLNESGDMGRVSAFLFMLVIFLGFITAIEGSLHVVITSLYDDILSSGRIVKINPKKCKRDIMIIAISVGVTTLLVAAYIEQMSISLIITFIATLGCSISPTVFLSLVWGKMNSHGCMAGLVAGLASVPFFKFAPFFLQGGERVSLCDILGINSVIPSMLTTVLFIVLFTVITRKNDDEMEKEVEKEFRSIKSRISE